MADFISSIYSREDDGKYTEYEIKVPAKNVYYVKEDGEMYFLDEIIKHYLAFTEKFNICFEHSEEERPEAHKGIFMLEEE